MHVLWVIYHVYQMSAHSGRKRGRTLQVEHMTHMQDTHKSSFSWEVVQDGRKIPTTNHAFSCGNCHEYIPSCNYKNHMIDAHYADDGEFEFDETCQEEYGKCQHTKLEEDNVKMLFKIQFYWEVTILRLPPTGLFKF